MGSPQQPTYIIPPPSGPNWKTPLLIGALVLLAVSSIFQFMQLDKVRSETKADMVKLTQDVNSAIERMKVDSNEEVQSSRRSVEALQARLAEQRRQAEASVGQAKIDAQRRVELLQQKVAAEEAQQQQAISQVKATADTATTQLASVTSDVGTVKTDVATTKSQLEQTISTLKRATGELDSHSSLIATNATELKALRELGERNYSEFTVNKSKQFTRVADISIELKKADPKKNRFTIEITADDKTVEKKDRTVNEPIQFYTSKARQPYEIVVNSVSKDKIAGYLATPKVMTGRGGA
jgi:multidrug efflux pump subunit AcrA (membrane-fusion protein)